MVKNSALAARVKELLGVMPDGVEGKELYTCIGKGGVYERLGVATGAGTSKTTAPVVVYKDVVSGRLFYRAGYDFDARMERLR